MLLAIDIGNTHTVAGLFEKGILRSHWRISSTQARTEDEIASLLNYFFLNEDVKISDLKGVAISSVVPDLTFVYKLMCSRYFNLKPLIINAESKLDMQVKYADPSLVGADRLCNAVAGKELYGTPLVVIDFGTATTFDCIDKNGDYLGGIISPGINTSIDALHKHAARLPKVDMDFPKELIGRTTADSIKSGIFFGTVFMVEGMIEKLKTELGQDTKIAATGGLASKIAGKTAKIEFVDFDLSLKGIASIYSKNQT